MTEERLFSRLVRVDALPREGQVITIEATPAEREELASFYQLPAIAALTATLRLDPWGQGGARVTGAVHGELTQICVVSLEPFPATVDEDVDVRFAPQTAANSQIHGDRGSADVFARRRRRARSRHRRKNRSRRSHGGVLRSRPRSLSAQARRGLRRGAREFRADDLAICGAGSTGQTGVRIGRECCLLMAR